MQNHLEDAAVLARFGCGTCLLFGSVWLLLGAMGVAGTIAGYAVGLLIYVSPAFYE